MTPEQPRPTPDPDCRYCAGRGWVVGGDEVRDCYCRGLVLLEADGRRAVKALDRLLRPVCRCGHLESEHYTYDKGCKVVLALLGGPRRCACTRYVRDTSDADGVEVAMRPTDLTTETSSLRGRRDALRHEAGLD